jgi:hypothetical protein
VKLAGVSLLSLFFSQVNKVKPPKQDVLVSLYRPFSQGNPPVAGRT